MVFLIAVITLLALANLILVRRNVRVLADIKKRSDRIDKQEKDVTKKVDKASLTMVKMHNRMNTMTNVMLTVAEKSVKVIGRLETMLMEMNQVNNDVRRMYEEVQDLSLEMRQIHQDFKLTYDEMKPVTITVLSRNGKSD